VSPEDGAQPPAWPGLPPWAGRLLKRPPPVAYCVGQAALERFSASGGSQAAAGLAYYALFSMFPLLLFVIGALGFVLRTDQVRGQVEQLIVEFFPTSQELIIENLRTVLELRGPATIVAAVSLLWSGSGFFTILAHHINVAWPGAERRGMVRGRVVGMIMVGVLIAVLAMVTIYNIVVQIVASLSEPLANLVAFYGPVVDALLSHIVPWVFAFGIYLTLYRLVPRAQVRWREAVIAAAAATIMVRITTAGFGLYLRSGFSRYHLVYGSLGSVVALLFWIYLIGWVTVFCAHLSATLGRYYRHEDEQHCQMC